MSSGNGKPKRTAYLKRSTNVVESKLPLPPKEPKKLSEPDRPPPYYQLHQQIRVPKEVDESCSAKILGYQWGPDDWKTKKKTNGWLYWIVFPNKNSEFVGGLGERFEATEEEISTWQTFYPSPVVK